MTAEVSLDIGQIIPRFPDYRVALVICSGPAITETPPPPVADYLAEAEAAIVRDWGDRPVSDIPEVRAWRDAYKGFGIRKTSYRPSVERLIRHIQRHGALPRINSFVDLYNAISVTWRMPAGADDLDKVTPPLAFRYARPGDSFIPLGDRDGRDDPPKDGEVVYADREKVLCRRWNWYQDDRSPTSPDAKRVVLTIQSFAEPVQAGGGYPVEEAAADFAGKCTEWLGGRVAWDVAHESQPIVTVAVPE